MGTRLFLRPTARAYSLKLRPDDDKTITRMLSESHERRHLSHWTSSGEVMMNVAGPALDQSQVTNITASWTGLKYPVGDPYNL